MRALWFVVLLFGCHSTHAALPQALHGNILVPGELDRSGISITLIGASIQTTTTNSDGEYAFAAVAPGTYRLIAAAEWTVEAELEQTLTVPTDTAPPSFAFSPLGRLVGNVTDPALQTLAGATIHDDLTRTTMISDAAGNFEWPTIATGSHTLLVTAAGYASWTSVATQVRWRRTTTLDPIVLTQEAPPTDAPAHFIMKVRRVGLTNHSQVTATLSPGDFSGVSSNDGTIDLGIVPSGVYTLTLSDATGHVVYPQLYVGDGHGFLFAPALVPLPILTVDWGEHLGGYNVRAISHDGRFAVVDSRVYQLDGATPTVALDLGAAGMNVFATKFLDDDSWLIVQALTSTAFDPPHFTFYRTRPDAWLLEPIAEADDQGMVLISKHHAMLTGAYDVTAPLSSIEHSQIVFIDTKQAVPIDVGETGSVANALLSASRDYAVLPSFHAAIVRLSDGAKLGNAGAYDVGETWHPYLDLLLYRGGGYHAFTPSDGTTIDYGAALPHGDGWTTTDNGGVEGAFVVAPIGGLYDAARAHAFDVTSTSIIDWSLPTATSMTLVDELPSRPTVERFYDGERRLMYSYSTSSGRRLGVFDRQTNMNTDLGTYSSGNFAAGRDSIVFVDANQVAWRAALDGTAPTHLADQIAAVSVHPAGTIAALQGSDNALYVVDLDGDTPPLQVADAGHAWQWSTPTQLIYIRSGSTTMVDTGVYVVTVSQ